VSIRALVVDDEPLGIQGVCSLLADEPDVDVVGECRNGGEAVKAIKALRPDLVFLDIQMPVMDGFEVLEELGEDEMPLVVFVTAFDQYSLQAFSVHALDYLLKPIERERLQEALKHIRKILTGRGQPEMIRKMMSLLEDVETHRRKLDRFVVRDQGRIFFVKAEQVDAIEATGVYIHLYRGKDSFMLREPLSSLEQRLDSRKFIRVHRSWILNVDRIQEIQPRPGGIYLVRLEGDRVVPVSRGYRMKIEALLDPE
jgi:two-component system LytT family response regulator